MQQVAMPAAFAAEWAVVRGVRVQVLAAGAGSPILFLHGAGTVGGFEPLLPLAKRHKVYVPLHPGWGESDDDPLADSMLDYVVHYASLCDQLGLDDKFDIVGHSLGGWMAALFATLQGHRIHKLALVCPAGLRVPEHPTIDLFTIPDEQLPSYLVADPKTLARLLPGGVTNEMKVQRYRERGSLARIIWERNYDPKLARWLDRVNVPTLLLWGEQDRCIPVQQAQRWANLIRGAEVETFPGAGHLLFAEAPAAVERLAAFLR